MLKNILSRDARRRNDEWGMRMTIHVWTKAVTLFITNYNILFEIGEDLVNTSL